MDRSLFLATSTHWSTERTAEETANTSSTWKLFSYLKFSCPSESSPCWLNSSSSIYLLSVLISRPLTILTTFFWIQPVYQYHSSSVVLKVSIALNKEIGLMGHVELHLKEIICYVACFKVEGKFYNPFSSSSGVKFWRLYIRSRSLLNLF